MWCDHMELECSVQGLRGQSCLTDSNMREGDGPHIWQGRGPASCPGNPNSPCQAGSWQRRPCSVFALAAPWFGLPAGRWAAGRAQRLHTTISGPWPLGDMQQEIRGLEAQNVLGDSQGEAIEKAEASVKLPSCPID